MKCQNKDCDRLLSPEDQFCPGCGLKKGKRDTMSFSCQYCGQNLQPGARFCDQCGMKVDDTQLDSLSVFCSGKKEDGSPCRYKLISSLSFCPSCGSKKIVPEASGSIACPSGSAVQRDINHEVSNSKQPTSEKENVPTLIEETSKLDIQSAEDQKTESVKQCLENVQSTAEDEVQADPDSSTGSGTTCTEQDGSHQTDMFTAPEESSDHTNTDGPGCPVEKRTMEAPEPVPCSDDYRCTATSKLDIQSAEDQKTESVKQCLENVQSTAEDEVQADPDSSTGSGSTCTEQDGSHQTDVFTAPEESSDHMNTGGSSCPVERSVPCSDDSRCTANNITSVNISSESNNSTEPLINQCAETATSQHNGLSKEPMNNKDLPVEMVITDTKECASSKNPSCSDFSTHGNDQTAQTSPKSAPEIESGQDEPSKVNVGSSAEGNRTESNSVTCADHPLNAESVEAAGSGTEQTEKEKEKSAGIEGKKDNIENTETAPGLPKSKGKDDKDARNENKKTTGQQNAHNDDAPVTSATGENEIPKQDEQTEKKTYAQAASGPKKPNTSREKTGQTKTGQSSLSNNADMVAVVFHVIVSDLWKEMDPTTCLVFIRFLPAALGTFNPKEDKHRMHCIRETKWGYLFEGKVMMTKSLRNSSSGFSYKYLVRKVSDKAEKSKIVWEIVQRKEHGTDPEFVNRQFSVPDWKRKMAGDWHRYDGVAYFQKEGILDKIVNRVRFGGIKDKVRSDAVSCASEFLPPAAEIFEASLIPVSNGQTTMEGYLEKVQLVMSSLKLTMRDSTQSSIDESLVKEAVKNALIEPITEKIKMGEGKVTLGLFLVLLMEEFSIPMDIAFNQMLCRSLMISPEMNSRNGADLDIIVSHFPVNMADKCGFSKRVISLIEQANQGSPSSDPSWLCCVPLVHFLQEKSKPYQDPEPSSNFRTDEWWGLTGLSKFKENYKTATKDILIPESTLSLVKKAFQVDPLFVRTFVACLDLTPLLPVLTSGIVPVDVMAAALAHYIRIPSSIEMEHIPQIGNCLNKMISKLQEDKKKLELGNLKEVTCKAEIIKDLHKDVVSSRSVTKDTVRNATYLVFLALDHLALMEDKACPQNERVQAEKNWRRYTGEVTRDICDWLSRELSDWKSGKDVLKTWDDVLSKVEDEVRHAGLKQAAKDLLFEGFEKNLSKLKPDQKLEIYLAQDTLAKDSAFADILNRLAFEALDAAFQTESKCLTDPENIRLVSLLSAFIEQKWREQVKDEEDVLKFVITWIPMVNYFKTFVNHHWVEAESSAGKEKDNEIFGKLATQNIKCALDCVKNLLDSLRDGSILIKNLRLVISSHEHFLAIVAAANHDQTLVSALLDRRQHELKAYTSAASHLDRMLNYCSQFLKTGDLQKVQRSAAELRNITDGLSLSDVVKIALPDSIQDLEMYNPTANPWKLPDSIYTILPVFGDRMSSCIFKELFSRYARNVDLSTDTLWQAFQVVWDDASMEWKNLGQQMIDGTITLAGTEKIFSMFQVEHGSYGYDEIAKELCKLDSMGSGQWVAERIEQFKCFTSIKERVKAASVFFEVRDVYNIEGDFGDIETIFSLSQDETLPVGNVDKSVLRLCKVLKDVTPQDVHCLEQFADHRCLEFVSWLRENMKGGVKEVHVFVELAFISAGEEPMAIGRVNCFHAAAVGYAPLIFIDKQKGYRHLLQKCKLVFANVKNDQKLPDKLLDSARLLDWFKEVQESHGSVEKTSLSQVGSINSRGVFRVGRGDRVTIPGVIQLEVSEDVDMSTIRGNTKDSTPPRMYSYEELLDLQSRLMLVAGQAEKGKENVDRFITIMESLVRLGKTYVQLCNDGCALFLDWTVEFLCDVSRPVCCISEFARQGKLKGQRSSPEQNFGRRESLEDFIACVASFLESCHSEWLQYVDQKRKNYPELNFFSVEQLVFLQQQLVKVGSAEVSKYVFPMLSLLKANTSPQDLEQALEDAMDFINSKEVGHQKPQQLTPVDDQDEAETFVMGLVDNGFSRALALKALKEVGPDDIKGGIAWCMNQEDDLDELSDEMSQDEEEEQSKKGLGERLKEWVTRRETVTESAIGWLERLDKRKKGTTLKSLTGNLRSVWSKFLESVSSSGMDFLSLEHLGIVLSCLAAKDDRKFERSLPPSIKPKTPNLILCPKNEVLNAVTYMYMFPENGNTPLPQPDEVLLCTEHTTFEQVDIFLRRAFFGTQSKVHCLAFADNLDYDVGEKTEKKIKEYTRMAGDRAYCLVVVCTAENEYRACIVAALEKYRRPPPSLSSTNKVRNYLHVQFSCTSSKPDETSASALDPENLCVRVVKSNRSGVGKTLYKKRQTAKLKNKLPLETRPVSITIPLHSRVADTQEIAANLLEHTLDPGTVLPRIVHLDISYQVLEGVDHLLYNLLVLGCVMDSDGRVWLRSPSDLYLVETMPLLDQKDLQRKQVLVHQIFDVLPSLSCWSPQDSVIIMRDPSRIPGYQKCDCLFDDEEYHSKLYQRPFLYLNQLDKQKHQLQAGPQGDAAAQKLDCLSVFLKYCGVVSPSWSELRHFVCFLNKQLQDFENSVYCGMATSQDLPGFSVFVLRFLIQMSRDFATRSLNMSEESLAALMPDDRDDADIQQYEMRRTWESSPHPYIFFNPDAHSMTFLGFSIDRATFNLLDQQTGQVLVQGIMTKQLYRALMLNRVPLAENFDELPREYRLLRLYRVLGLFDEEIFDDNNQIIDPDDTYELTTDNVKKILAIYMRFRCNIPVIVMGETGCGKTRLVKFLCALQTPRDQNINTMVLVKVHGGTTGEDIIRKVRQAEKVAQKNAKVVGHRPVYTVLFFDEANTTEAVGVIKEIMCDGTLRGQQISLSQSLKMVAACNPYRKHSDELIERLENAGLGYHVDADKTVDKLGRVPMRHLVYRVQPLPQSMLPLVWDFGQLKTHVEELYIRQMVRHYVRNGQLDPLNEAEMNVLCKILMESQEFMRQLADECSFVSLRDVDRALAVTSWFLQQARQSRFPLDKLDQKPNLEEDEEFETASESVYSIQLEAAVQGGQNNTSMTDMTKALVLSLAVCYRACLRSKEEYDEYITAHFTPPFSLPDNTVSFADIIDRCQDVFLDNVRLEKNIARNQALKENVFMMVVCIELRIPLFLVGKPGSSKSLAKTIVSDAMQGNFARSQLFKTLKQAQMVSFQCSPLATADGILGTFRQCAQYQKDKDKDKFVSVVVLDEVGLAEDSPKMPLKTLHPLLEDGCPGDEKPDDSKKVAFIGISNWALDPAKMNRGILVQRDVPDETELIETARGICTTKDKLTMQNLDTLIPELARAYLRVFEEAKQKREFFGLRDFYSLVKMVYTFAAQSRQPPSQRQLIAAIRRNFGGLETIDPLESFKDMLTSSLCEEKPQPYDPDCSSSGLIKAALSGDDMGGESRYLLLLTENYGGLSILSEHLLADRHVVLIFGSSFPKDQEYTQICRNINRIKVCMETGQTVILLNLENLYESLYDALNQYYAMLGGERYVDLGLGTHRVKCRVHQQFRLIVVAEKQAVYDKFPIPLINRLEKHFLTLNNIMSKDQLAIAERLETWAEEFVSPPEPMMYARARGMKKKTAGDIFMGYHPDTAPAIVLKIWDALNASANPAAQHKVLEECQRVLLWCATPDAVVRRCEMQWSKVYHDKQQHDHLLQYLQQRLQQHSSQATVLMAQVTTHSKLLTEQDRAELCQSLPVGNVTLLSLQAFDTEHQFCQQLRQFFIDSGDKQKLLIVQCDSGDSNQNLIKCAQYCMQDLRPDHCSQHHVVFIIQLPRIAGACFTGFLGGNWHCLHMDDLRATVQPVPPISLLQSQTPADLIMASLRTGVDHTSHDQMAQGFDIQYVRDLFMSAIQAATAMVRDFEEVTARATHRITILLQLIEENTEFFHGLLRLVGNILKEQEQKMYQAEKWLSREAAKPASVQKAGTFRRSWMQYMENKVVPVLAAVIAYMDTNHNLDLLYTDTSGTETQNSSRPEWVVRVWLDLLQGVCQLKYKDLLSTSGNDELDEFTVHHTAAGSVPFSARLPFSWLLWELVESAISRTKQMEGDLPDDAGDVVDHSPLGKCLCKAVADSDDSLQELFQMYIADLLYCNFPVNAQQHKLLCTCVEKGLQQLNINLEQLGHGTVVLHMLVEQMRPRLQSIVDTAGCRPNAVEAMMVAPAGSCAELLGIQNEMTEDVAMLTLVLEELQPRPNQLEKEECRQEWLAQYNAFAPVVLRILSDSDGASVSLLSAAAGTEAESQEGEETVRENNLPYGPKCKQQLIVVRSYWTRITTLKLFLEYIGPLRQGPPQLRKALGLFKLQLLYTLLGDDVDMKQQESLANLDKFLKRANGSMIKGLLGEVGKCNRCDKKFESAPVELPCKHLLCNSCYRECHHGYYAEAKCPECKETVPENFNPADAGVLNREAVEMLGQYQRQVSGFLMAVVSKLCFAGKEPPDPAAVRHIFGYIIHKSKGRTLLQTKQMTVHDDLIDPTPVLRSFLLRLLLKHSEEEVHSYLDEFLTNAQEMEDQEMAASGDVDGTPTRLEFALLIINCIEDLHHEQDAVISGSLNEDERQLSLTDMLHNHMHVLTASRMALPSLYSLGHLRCALAACAHVLHKIFVSSRCSPVISEELKNLLFELCQACTGESDWPKKFLVKQFCREYGIQDFKKLAQLAKREKLLRFIVIEEEANKVDEVVDRFLVCGEHYKTVRDQVAQMKVAGDSENLLQLLQTMPLTSEQKEMLLLLALHREVTMSVLHPLSDQVRTAMAENVKKLIQDYDILKDKDKELAKQLCDNQLGDAGTLLRMDQSYSGVQQSLVCLLTHLHLVLSLADKNSDLLNPLIKLVFEPADMANAYLPTMPEDNIKEILAAIKEKLWQCPRGHRYMIGNCGRPNQTGMCPCGQRIGGTNHAAIQGNTQISGTDQTQTGHILGPATQRGQDSLPERSLSSVECALVRCVVHMALYLGTMSTAQAAAISAMVVPNIAPGQAAQFFLDHIEHDLRVLQRALGRSRDDVFLVLHRLCHGMAGTPVVQSSPHLQTKEGRKMWEKSFAEVIIAPVIKDGVLAHWQSIRATPHQSGPLQEDDYLIKASKSTHDPYALIIDQIVRDGNQAILSDKRRGDHTLLKVVYDDEEQATRAQDLHHLETNPSMWRYRPPITVDHFFRQFDLQLGTSPQMKETHAVLRLFQDQRHIVYALHYVPAILIGQRRVMMRFHRRLDRAEAATLTIDEIMSQYERTGLEELMYNFSKAWEIVKEHLIGFQCVAPIEGVMVSLKEEFHNISVTRDSPLAMLLPALQGPGLCSYILLQYLLGKNNDFLQKYSCVVSQRFKSFPEVSVHAITERHLIGCSPEQDLLPMVLSHCNYNLMVGHAATLDYDFAAFQRQLQDTVLQGKAKVQKSAFGHFDVQTMAYRADTTSSRLFRVVRKKIDQESLSPAERRQIWEDLRDNLPDICHSIDNLNTAVSFLKALGGSPSDSLHDFMTEALRMKHTLYSRRARQICSLTHVQSLWIILCYRRACILAVHQQDAFDGVETKLNEELTPEQGEEVEAMCQQMSAERLELLLLQLFECIMLHLSEPQSQDDDTRPENFSLRDVLITNMESPLYHVEPVEVRSGLLRSDDLSTFPESLEGRHAITVWIQCCTHPDHKR